MFSYTNNFRRHTEGHFYVVKKKSEWRRENLYSGSHTFPPGHDTPEDKSKDPPATAQPTTQPADTPAEAPSDD